MLVYRDEHDRMATHRRLAELVAGMLPEQVAEKLYVPVKDVTSSAAETLKRIGVPCSVVPVHSPA